MFCHNCGTTNPDSGQFCSTCGSPLTAAAAVRPTTGPGAVGGSSFATPPPLDGNPPTSGKAIASLVCGIFTFFLPASIAAVILGHLSLSEIRRSAGRLGGRGLATTGLVLGYLGLMVLPVMIVAAIAIPNLLRTRIFANESASNGSLRTINTGAAVYAATWGNGFPSSLAALGGAPIAEPNCNHALLIDPVLASGRKSGYIYTYTPHFPGGATAPVISPKAAANGCTSGGASGYTVTADPIQRGTTGQRSFFTDQSGIIRVSNDGESATADSPPLQ